MMAGFVYVLCSVVSLFIGVAAFFLARQETAPSTAVLYLQILAGAGVLGFVLLSVTGYQKWKREGLRIEALHSSGIRVSAAITGLEQDRAIAVNRQYPYRIVCSWKDPRSGSSYQFRSARIFHDPNFELRDKKSITVFLDPADYTNYDVDLSSVGIQP